MVAIRFIARLSLNCRCIRHHAEVDNPLHVYNRSHLGRRQCSASRSKSTSFSFPAILSCSCTPLTIYDHFQSTFNTVLFCTGNNLQGDCTTIIVEEKVCGIVDSDLVDRVNSLAPLGGSSCDFFAYVSHLEPFQCHSVLLAPGTQKSPICVPILFLISVVFFPAGVNR